jgi:hypothetical protein
MESTVATANSRAGLRKIWLFTVLQLLARQVVNLASPARSCSYPDFRYKVSNFAVDAGDAACGIPKHFDVARRRAGMDQAIVSRARCAAHVFVVEAQERRRAADPLIVR